MKQNINPNDFKAIFDELLCSTLVCAIIYKCILKIVI